MGAARYDASLRALMIERRTPIKRTALKGPTMERVQAWQRKPRKALPKIGPKALREKAALKLFRRAVKANALGQCQAPFGEYAPDGRWIHVEHSASWLLHPGAHCHHVWPEDHDRGVHDPERGLYLCAGAHRWVHLNPADAAILRLLRPDE